uniref:DUF4794 domain-containing protein n=1 Tax=Bactrocera dorsalis TaxID=27457 RepID=A0A034VZX2_BACDO
MRLTIFILLAVVIAVVAATPLKRPSTHQRQRVHSARQVLATTAQPVQARTGYPAAGFRPHIPFELPNERRTTELPAVSSTPAPASDATTAPAEDTAGSGDVNVDIEVIVEGADVEENEEKVATTTENPKSDAEDDVELQVEINEETSEAAVETHTPAIEYGPPVVDADTVEEPAEHFQLPNKDAEEFAASNPTLDADVAIVAGSAATNFDADAPAQPVADFPAVAEETFTPTVASSDDDNAGAAPIDVSGELDAEAAEQPIPAATYGPPTGVDVAESRLPAETYGAPGVEEAESRLPADTYGAPGVVAVMPPVIEEEDFGVELNELEPAAAAEDAELSAEQIELLSGLSDLQSGRLIFVPSDGGNLRQIFFAAPPQQRRADRNGRLVRV